MRCGKDCPCTECGVTRKLGEAVEFTDAERGLLEYLEQKTDKRGHRYCIDNGKRVPCPKKTAAAKKPALKKPAAKPTAKKPVVKSKPDPARSKRSSGLKSNVRIASGSPAVMEHPHVVKAIEVVQAALHKKFPDEPFTLSASENPVLYDAGSGYAVSLRVTFGAGPLGDKMSPGHRAAVRGAVKELLEKHGIDGNIYENDKGISIHGLTTKTPLSRAVAKVAERLRATGDHPGLRFFHGDKTVGFFDYNGGLSEDIKHEILGQFYADGISGDLQGDKDGYEFVPRHGDSQDPEIVDNTTHPKTIYKSRSHEVDWRPNEMLPEDHYSEPFGADAGEMLDYLENRR